MSWVRDFRSFQPVSRVRRRLRVLSAVTMFVVLGACGIAAQSA